LKKVIAANNPTLHRNIQGKGKIETVGLQISTRECGDVNIVNLQGRSTVASGESELLSKHLRELTATGKRKLLLNLANLLHIDSSGVSIIVETYVSLKRCGGDLKLLSPRGRVLDVLRVFRLLDVIPSFEDDFEAVTSFGRGFTATS
jgi:anti-sigma B factor antagonist